jgi:hypothetical protein
MKVEVQKIRSCSDSRFLFEVEDISAMALCSVFDFIALIDKVL